MKKTLLLASAATCVFAFNAKAVEFKPYVDLDMDNVDYMVEGSIGVRYSF